MKSPISVRKSDRDPRQTRGLRCARRAAVGAWLIAAGLALMIVLVGCGGEDSSAPPQSAPVAPSGPMGSGAPGSGGPTPPVAQTAPDQPQEETQPAQEPEPVEPAAPPRPSDVSDWSQDDFRTAKENRDPRLLDAVALLGEEGVGDKEAARLLRDLLLVHEDPEPEPKPETKGEPKQPSGGAGGSPGGMGGMMGGMDMEGGMGGDMEDDMEDMMGGMGGDMEDDMEGMGGYPGGEDYGSAYPGRSGSPGGRSRDRSAAAMRATYVSLTGGIVRALGANDTDASRAVLEQLLAGRIDTGNDRVVAAAVLRALADNPCRKNEAILFRALTSSQTYRPPAPRQPAGQPTEERSNGARTKPAAKPATVTAEVLRESTWRLIEQSASARLRFDLTKYVTGSPSMELAQRLVGFLGQSHPYNVASQSYLYSTNKAGQKALDDFELFFTAYSSVTLGRAMGVSAEKEPETIALQPLPGRPPSGSNGPFQAFSDNPTPRNGTGRPPGSGSGSGYPGMEGMEGMMGGMEDMMGGMEDMEGMEGMMGGMEDMEGMEGMMGGMDDMEGMMGGMGGYPGGEGSPGSGGRRARRSKADVDSVKRFDEVAQDNSNLTYEMAQQFWSARFAGIVGARLDRLDKLADGPQLLSLASTIPTDAMRARLYATLKGHWQEGPDALDLSAELPETGAYDPGYITLLKMLPRKEPRTQPTRSTRGRRRGGDAGGYDGGGSGDYGGGEPGGGQRTNAPELTAENKWMATSLAAVEDVCSRLQAAAKNRPAQQEEALADLPFRLHRDAKVTAAYKLDWVDQVGAGLAPLGMQPDPMLVRYIRIEEQGLFAKMQRHYVDQVKSATVRDHEKGVWLDSFRDNPLTGRKQSIDVLVTRANGRSNPSPPSSRPSRSSRSSRSPQPSPEPESLVIEILLVEVNSAAGDEADE